MVFGNVLALMVYSVLELLARRRGIEATARRLLEDFRGLSVIFLLMEDGERVVVTEELTPRQAKVVRKLGLPSPGRILEAEPGNPGAGAGESENPAQGGVI